VPAVTGPVGAADWHVEIRGLVKQFGGAQALAGVDLDIRRGSIHGLVGENGAGKSTLGRVIAGALTPDDGELLVNGRAVHFRAPRDALREGITLIAQELALVPKLTVLENVFLGVEPAAAGLLRRRSPRDLFAALDTRTGFRLDPDRRVHTLRIADQQKVEILRALVREARLIIMDEPTAALAADDHARLFEIIRQLRDDGVTIVYVSHFLAEVLALVDDVTVLKDGVVVSTSEARAQTADSLVTAMVGRALSLRRQQKHIPAERGRIVLSVRGLARVGVFDEISFDVRAGEILGLAGLVGSGRSEVARAIFGADRLDGGTISVDGRPVRIRTPRDAVRAGVVMLPESRKDQGLLMRRPVRENVSLPHLEALSHGPFVDGHAERRSVDEITAKVDLRARSLSSPIRTLSGGNQQKALFAKWLLRGPALLIADEPTRGVDVGAKEAIHELLAGHAAQGTAIILISSEFDEVAHLAHRVLVMRTGRIAAELEGEGVTEGALVHAAFGTTPDGEDRRARGPAA
jgi:simple sugar transport system ATP-binding protein/ribose transport system ATP-binding protein